MTHDDRSLERAARSWLEEGPTQAPDRTVETALARVQSTSQERGLALPWRLPTMNPLMRLAGAAIVAVLAAGVVFLTLRPTSSLGPPATPSPAPTTSRSVEPTIELPSARQLAPTAVIDLAGMVPDTIPLTTDGTDLWVGVDGAVIHIDGKSNATTRINVPQAKTGNGEIMITSDGLWMEDYRGLLIRRIDPTTGKLEVQAPADLPRTITYVNDQLWIGTNGATPGAYEVDRQTGALGPRIGTTRAFAVGMGQIWVGEWNGSFGDNPEADVITRLDPATGASAGTITVQKGSGCGVGGSFPDNVWATCPSDFGACRAGSVAVRIDPATNRAVTTARICGGPAAVIDGTPWFLVGRTEGTDVANSLVSVDPATGRLLARLDLGKVDPDVIVVTGDALWMSDEEGDRVVRYDFTQLRG